jgi:hypothetical protein
MFRSNRSLVPAAGLTILLACAASARAAVIDVASVSETAFGNQLAGTKVTATFGNGSTESVTWAATGATSGAATGTNWSLSLTGDTFFSSFVLSNNRTGGTGSTSPGLIKSLLIEPLGSNGVFDMASPPLGLGIGTPNSSLGTTFNTILNGFSSLATVDVNTWFLESANLSGSTYIDDVAVGGQPPVGDLRGSLLINFTSVSGLTGFFSPVSAAGLPGRVSNVPTEFTFRADTDLIEPAQIPEPASLVVFGVVTAGALGLYWRRKKGGPTAVQA